jgi:NADPH:quinone reductase
MGSKGEPDAAIVPASGRRAVAAGDGGLPSTGPGEILVRVRARSGAMPGDGAGRGGAGAAGAVIAAGGRVTRFAVGDEVFGHLPAESWRRADAGCVPTAADGPHVEHRPRELDPGAAAALAVRGLTAMTILRAAAPQPGHTALVIGATTTTATVLVPLLADAGARVIAAAAPGEDDHVRSLGAAETVAYTAEDRLTDALARVPDADVVVDLVSFSEPYFITAAAPQGTIVTALPGDDGLGVPRIPISAAAGDLAALARRALERGWPRGDREASLPV